MRILIPIAAMTLLAGPASSQTQPTRPTAWAVLPTLPTFQTSPLSPCYSSLNPTSPCYSGNRYPYYSAVLLEPLNTPVSREEVDISQLSEQDVKQRMKAKGYEVTSLEKDSRGIWRGPAKLKDGRRVQVTLDLAGNIYSKLATPVSIWFRDE